MASVLITGVSGFVGRHLAAGLLQTGHQVLGFDRSGGSYGVLDEFLGAEQSSRVTKLGCDLSDPAGITALFGQVKFDAIVHLAGISFPPVAWTDPAGVLDSNTRNTILLLQIAREQKWRGRFLFVSSSDVYGKVSGGEMPITEDTPVAPDNPYGASKAAAEMFVRCLGDEGIEALIARPFNHIGPGQAEQFVLPAFLKRILQCRISGDKVLETGDLQSVRDFTDVRDVVRAYDVLLRKGEQGATYNICSGRGTTIRELLDTALRVAGVSVEVRTNRELLRPEGPSIRFGSAARLGALGWSPSFSLEETIRDTLASMEAAS